MSRFQRIHADGREQRVTTLELFYDLVFVFAITQVSHLLLEHLTWEGAAQSALILLVVGWSWNYTTWVTNELGRGRARVAVGDELVIAHPTDVLPEEEVAAVVAGPAMVLFRLRMAGSLSRKRLGGAIACVAAAGIGAFAPRLVLAALVLAILVAVIAAEVITGARRRARGEPSPLEALERA